MNALKSILVALIALTGANFAINQVPVLTQIVVPLVLVSASALVVRRALLQGELTATLGVLLTVSVIVGIIYAGCVVMAERDIRVITSFDFLKVMLRFSVIPCSFAFGYLQNWSNRGLREILATIASLTLIYLSLMRVILRLDEGFVVEKFHSNQLGIMGVIAIYYGVLFRDGLSGSRVRLLLIVAGLIAAIVSNSRGAWFCCLLFFGFLWMQSVFRLSRVLRVAVFMVIVGFSLTVTFFYTTLIETDLAVQISDISERTIGKRFDTGRANYWRRAADELSASPWVGLGLYAHDSWNHKREDGTEYRLSVHSYYWAIMQEVGYVGMASVLLLFAVIWWIIVAARHEYYSRVALAFFGAVLIQEISEVMLSTGTYTVGTSVWIAIAAGVSLGEGTRRRVVLRKEFSGETVSEFHPALTR